MQQQNLSFLHYKQNADRLYPINENIDFKENVSSLSEMPSIGQT